MKDDEAVKAAALCDALYQAWTILANVSGGDWTQQSEEWQSAVVRWRDEVWHPLLAARIAETAPEGAAAPILIAAHGSRIAAAIRDAGHPDGYHRVDTTREWAGIYCADCAVTERSARIAETAPEGDPPCPTSSTASPPPRRRPPSGGSVPHSERGTTRR